MTNPVPITDGLVVTTAPECRYFQWMDFYHAVMDGGAIYRDCELDNAMDQSKNLIFYYDKKVVVGTVCLKQPTPEYRKEIEEKAGVSLDEREFPYEIGYKTIRPEYRGRGIGTLLTKQALECADGKGVFVTCRQDDMATQTVVTRLGFTQIGTPYTSEWHGHNLIVLTNSHKKD